MSDYSWHIPDPETQPEFYADVPVKRLLAWLVDTGIILAICLLIVLFTAFIGLFFFPMLMLAVGFAYRTVTIANRSATPGMQLFAIEFRTLRGERFDLPMAALHTAMLTGSFLFPLIQLASCVMMMTTPRAQGLSDLLLGTVAINRPAAR
ncbi:RDD family protein [Roseovarius faecimaris]|uniref:RDD family protein n=1 Tax=Roseovarius faecimaris TaxID=2494550 RepID=A0A6I6IQP9_9RHOB|nr:RDD family protein [Roseovarius faecimaris]QGX98211.1 RDD family protein [Roseovarius faecimaris]